MGTARSLALFALAGLAEIGGGYLVWRWLRHDAALWVGLAGAATLVIYGVIPTFQKASSFGRIYAAYSPSYFLTWSPTCSLSAEGRLGALASATRTRGGGMARHDLDQGSN